MANTDLKTFLEKIMRDYEKDDGIVITVLHEKDCSTPGLGFMSEVFGTEVVGTQGSGLPYTNNVFIKRPPSNPTKAVLFQVDRAFMNEAIIYRDLLPLIPEGRGNIPRCYYGGHDCIVLENLRIQGYKMADRKKGLDLAHSVLAMKAIGAFHSSTYHMRIEKEDKFFQISSKLYNILKENLTFVKSFESSLIQAIENLKEVPDESMVTALKKLESFNGKMSHTMEEIQKSEFIVLGHGDFCVNNMMFRYENGVVQDIRIVDLQLCLPMSPAADIWKFLYTSISPDLLNSHCDILIATYISFFQETLIKLNVPRVQIPDVAFLKNEINSRELYGLIVAIFYLPVMYIDFSDKSVDIEKLITDPEIMKQQKKFINKDFSDRLACLIRRCHSRNVL